MPRFILDVKSTGLYKMSSKQVDKIIRKMNEDLFDGEIFIITCIDRTTNNQFYIDDENSKYTDNKLSNEQIDNYNNILKTL